MASIRIGGEGCPARVTLQTDNELILSCLAESQIGSDVPMVDADGFEVFAVGSRRECEACMVPPAVACPNIKTITALRAIGNNALAQQVGSITTAIKYFGPFR